MHHHHDSSNQFHLLLSHSKSSQTKCTSSVSLLPDSLPILELPMVSHVCFLIVKSKVIQLLPMILHSTGFLSFPMRFLIHSIFLYYTSWIYYPFGFLLLSWVSVLIPLLLHSHLKSVCIAKAVPFIPSCYRRTLCHFFDCLDIVYLIIQKMRFIFLSQMNHYLCHIVQMCITSNLKSFYL